MEEEENRTTTILHVQSCKESMDTKNHSFVCAGSHCKCADVEDHCKDYNLQGCASHAGVYSV